ncbi:hypothetical protein CONPUDRAFT_169573 [Coniophora puteana RWD-64-598 SS2]|uniref:Uncharacterized protein n=1 Tax=Coniophora puteana (strain RWD-64-598) TaxID=741705 RepID=A0A5M3M754_CONPW|nr:uncharacterized protein CONPUDRAFT_169573 [Coniophora puteana RWD-64-598 SS2]EIW75162.1 hypothetical protein CONPUDRAFT_169573 [Coniophora puteana RWD-64-598 SS2]
MMSTRKPRVMRNRYEQHMYDTFGDGPEYEQFYVSDEHLNGLFRDLGIPESEFAKYRRDYDARMEKQLDMNGGKIDCQGRKPRPDEDPTIEHVHVVHIPGNDSLVIRLWDGGLEDDGEFCLDIYDMSTKISINSSELGFSFNVAPKPGTLSVLCGGRLRSWEDNAGYTPERILPGEERFSALEGAYLALRQPNSDLFWFKVPMRNRPPAGVTRAVSPIPL